MRGPSLCHREKAVGIYIQYILLASRYVLVSTFSSTRYSCTIYMLKNIVCLHCDHHFCFLLFLFCSGWNSSHFCVLQVNGAGNKEHCFIFNSYHIHRGICIEGTSMHLNCLHDRWKAVFNYLRTEKNKQTTKNRKYPRTYRANRWPHSL